jgi:hypothetical protein
MRQRVEDTMTDKDDGIVYALLERFEKIRLPRVLDVKERVDRGEVLSELDLDYLERLMRDATEVQRLVAKHPELEPLYGRAVGLYHEITKTALENEKRSHKS